MIRNQILSLLKSHKRDLAIYDVKNLFLFGSVARDDETSQSDVDVLVTFQGPPTFDHYMDLKFYLEELFQRKVDLVTESGLRPEVKKFVEKDLIRAA